MPFFGIEAKYPTREDAIAYAKSQGGRWTIYQEDGWWRLTSKLAPKHIHRFYVVVDGAVAEFTDILDS